jgi:hypothetical protein
MAHGDPLVWATWTGRGSFTRRRAACIAVLARDAESRGEAFDNKATRFG